MVDDSIQDSTISAELSKTYENKYNPYDVILLGGIGYTSTRRIEIDVLSAAFNIGTRFFGIDWLLADYTFLRFDRRLERTEDGKKIYESSIWGIASSLLGLATLSMADSINTTFGKIAFGTLSHIRKYKVHIVRKQSWWNIITQQKNSDSSKKREYNLEFS